MKKLLTPRGYLSWSAINLWLNSPQKYKDHYFFGEENVISDRMDFGSKVATAMENGKDTDDEIINMLIALLPRLPKREHEIRVPLKTSGGIVDILGKMDQFDPKTLAIRETKTGILKWTQSRADKHRQLDHYAALVWIKYKKLPSEIWLDWVQTEKDENGAISLTGQIKSFRVEKTLSDILSYLSLVARVSREIDAAYRQEMKL